jgi:RNA-splicing ligase RtcB
MESNGIRIKATSKHVIEEEAPGAYKDVDSVVRVSDSTGIVGCCVKNVDPLVNVSLLFVNETDVIALPLPVVVKLPE